MSKKIILLASAVCVLFSVGLQAQTPYSYYYKGQKINLTVNETYLHIIADNAFLSSPSANSAFEIFNLECETQNIPSTPNAQSMVKLKFKSPPPMYMYDAVVNTFKQHPNIKKVLPFFEYGEEPIGTSDIFYVKLNSLNTNIL